MKGDKGIQGFFGVQGAKGDRSERDERGAKGDKGIQRDNSNGEKMCFIKYHVSENMSSIVELTGGVGTLRCVSTYHEPAWHFDAKFFNGEGHEMETYRKRHFFRYEASLLL